MPRRTVYYRPTKKAPVVQQQFAQPIKQLIEEHPAFGYRTVAHLLSFNKNTVQRVFQLMRWQVKKRPVGFRPRVQAMPSVAGAPMSGGRPICVACKLAAMGGPCWRW